MSLRAVLADVSEAEATAVWNALAQWVENEQCDGVTDTDPALPAAEALLERLDAAVAAKADAS